MPRSNATRLGAAWRGAVVALLVALAGGAVAVAMREPAPSRERPNILVIVTDDMRATGTLGVMPETRRWFGGGGTRFTRAFATTPLCCPSRTSIMTGRYAHNHGVNTNYQTAQIDQETTLQHHLQEAGYTTAIAGKYLNFWDADLDPPYFDRWSIFLEGTYYDRMFNFDGVVTRDARYSGEIVTERSLRYMNEFENDDGRPWFLYVGTPAAHAPYTPPDEYVDAPVPEWHPNPAIEAGAEEDAVELQVHPREPERVRRGQLRTLMYADDMVGRLFDRMKSLDEDEQTLAIFVSDNGQTWGERGFTGKRTPHTASVQVPMFLRWPGRVDAGVTDDRLAANVDLAPTILEAAGVERDDLDGRSLLGPPTRKTLLLEHWPDRDTRVPRWASLRTEDYQYIEYYRGGEISAREYYDLAADPWQLVDLTDEPDADLDVNALHRELARLRRCSQSRCP